MSSAFTPSHHSAAEHLQQPTDGVPRFRITQLTQLGFDFWPHRSQCAGVRHHQFFSLVRQKFFRCAIGNSFTYGFVGTECSPKDIADGRLGIAKQLIAGSSDFLTRGARIAFCVDACR